MWDFVLHGPKGLGLKVRSLAELLRHDLKHLSAGPC